MCVSMVSLKSKFKVLSSVPLAVLAGVLFLSLVASCNNEFDRPPMVLPTAEHSPNMTIADFKARFWRDEVNYIDSVTEDIVIHGWVTSSDESGNIYKKLYIQDESGMGLTIAINQGGLYEKYRIGQELVLNLQGAFVGKYNGQQELGFPDTANYRQYGTWRMSFMAQPAWESMVELNGFYHPSAIDTMVITIDELADNKTALNLMKFQGALVRINGLKFREADNKAVFAPAESSYTNRTLVDANGRTLIVRTNNHADFSSTPLPVGTVDVVGLLDLFVNMSNASRVWQLSLRSVDDVIPRQVNPE